MDTLMAIWEIKETPGELLSYVKFSDDELSWFSNFRNEVILSQKICTRILIKQMLNNNITVSYDSYNSPVLNNTDYKVSLSHSGPYVVVILCRTKQPGIDIEKIHDRILKIEEKFLSILALEIMTNFYSLGSLVC